MKALRGFLICGSFFFGLPPSLSSCGWIRWGGRSPYSCKTVVIVVIVIWVITFIIIVIVIITKIIITMAANLFDMR